MSLRNILSTLVEPKREPLPPDLQRLVISYISDAEGGESKTIESIAQYVQKIGDTVQIEFSGAMLGAFGSVLAGALTIAEGSGPNFVAITALACGFMLKKLPRLRVEEPTAYPVEDRKLDLDYHATKGLINWIIEPIENHKNHIWASYFLSMENLPSLFQPAFKPKSLTSFEQAVSSMNELNKNQKNSHSVKKRKPLQENENNENSFIQKRRKM